MRFGTRAALITIACAAAVGTAASPASAAPPSGNVYVFSHEFAPVTVFEYPQGCNAVPVGAHIVHNDTHGVVRLYADPLCLFPAEPFHIVKPGHAAHVSSVGSFRA